MENNSPFSSYHNYKQLSRKEWIDFNGGKTVKVEGEYEIWDWVGQRWIKCRCTDYIHERSLDETNRLADNADTAPRMAEGQGRD